VAAVAAEAAACFAGRRKGARADCWVRWMLIDNVCYGCHCVAQAVIRLAAVDAQVAFAAMLL
jgi:hypothetical protein